MRYKILEKTRQQLPLALPSAVVSESSNPTGSCDPLMAPAWPLRGSNPTGSSEYFGIPGSVSGMTAMKSWSPTPVSVDTMWYNDKWYILQGFESSGRIQFKKTASSAKDYSSNVHIPICVSVGQPVMAMPQAFFLIHRFSKIPWDPRLMGRSVNVWQMIIDHRLSRFYS